MTKIKWFYRKNYEKAIGKCVKDPFPDDGVRIFISHKNDKRNESEIISLVFRFGKDVYRLFSKTNHVIFAIDYCDRRIYFTSGTKQNGYKLYNQPNMRDVMEFKRIIPKIEEYSIYPYCGLYLIHSLDGKDVHYISFDERIRV